jgi:hypothetical protein
MSQTTSGIRLIRRNQISNEKWDFLCQKLEYPIFNSIWYLDSVSEDWSAYVLNDYELALPVFLNKKFGFSYSLQPLFIRSISLMGSELKKQNDFLIDVLKQFNFFELNFENQHYDLFSNFEISNKTFQILTFKENYDLTRKSYSENAKRKLKQFQKFEPFIEKSENMDDLIEIFKNEKGDNFQNLNDLSYRSLKKIMTFAILNNYGNVYSVRLNNEILAIGFFIHYGNHLLYLKGAVTKRGKEKGAMYGLFDFIIRKYHGSYSQLDFGGSNDVGVAGFNKKFGACDLNYLILKKNKLIWPLNLLLKHKLGL